MTPISLNEAAEIADRLWQGGEPDPLVRRDSESAVVLVHEPTASLVNRRDALRNVYRAIADRIGEPTLLGGSASGPDIRWYNEERTLELAGHHNTLVLIGHDTATLWERDWNIFEGCPEENPDGTYRIEDLPYLWQLDRGGPGTRPPATNYEVAWIADTWRGARDALESLLTSWAEQIPVQAPGDWVSFKLGLLQDQRRFMVIPDIPGDTYIHYLPDDEGREFTVSTCAPSQNPEQAGQMRARGWQDGDEHGWWRTTLPEADPRSPSTIANLVVAEVRAHGATSPSDLMTWEFSVGDIGELWVPGIGVDHPMHNGRA